MVTVVAVTERRGMTAMREAMKAAYDLTQSTMRNDTATGELRLLFPDATPADSVAYPALSAAFARAFHEIVVRGKPMRPTLDAAARRVESDLRDHQYYPPPPR